MHKLAMQSRSRAYCPYSNFAVGSCVLGINGKYYTGCNVEKAVNSLCAEGTAIVKMVEDRCREISLSRNIAGWREAGCPVWVL